MFDRFLYPYGFMSDNSNDSFFEVPYYLEADDCGVILFFYSWLYNLFCSYKSYVSINGMLNGTDD